MKKLTHYLKNETATQQFAQKIAHLCQSPLFITLRGELGSGKTTLVRALLRELGVQGPVKSPSYSLVEPYHLEQFNVYHFDWYRLVSPEELELIAWRDYLSEKAVIIVEWPEKGEGMLPTIDLALHLIIENSARTLEIESSSEKGDRILSQL